MTPGPEVVMRVERDAMGEVLVPVDARWGAQTQRAVANFPISGRALDPRVIRALARIKGAAAVVNAGLDDVPAVDRELADAIDAAAAEVAAGGWADQFPVDTFQTGSGTSSNMNVNEVLASLATERLGGRAVHPNDHVNASQSSNDVFPSAVRIAALVAVVDELRPALVVLRDALTERAAAFAHVVKAGRTHLMDATPVTLGQELDGYAAQIDQNLARLDGCLGRVGELPLGGTATGTGLNCPPGFAPAVIGRLAVDTGLPLTEAVNHFSVQGAADALVELSGHLRTTALTMAKIADDLRWMASGPRTGLAEIHLPDLQPGSSIMPGKVNPVLCEVVVQVAAQVVGNDAAVAFAASRGAFELLTSFPVLARNVLESTTLLASSAERFALGCVAGIEVDEARCRAYAEATPAVAAALNPVLGYDRASAIVKESMRTGRTVRELLRESGEVPEADLDRTLDLLRLTQPGVA